MLRFRNLFRKKTCSVIGMIHVGALPGTPLYNGNTTKIIDDALNDASIYKEHKLDGILVENMHDIPYVQPIHISPEITATMTRVCAEIKKILPENIPCGLQILAGCNKEAIAVAKAVNFQFIRAEGFVFSHVADEGFTNANAGTLLRYRKQIDADDVLIFADIKKKHSSHAITSDVSLPETAKAAEFFLADGIILTGTATGEPANTTELTAKLDATLLLSMLRLQVLTMYHSSVESLLCYTEVKRVAKGPVLIGSGITLDNVKNYLSSDAIIVGSHFKFNGAWRNAIDENRVKDFMINFEKLQSIRI